MLSIHRFETLGSTNDEAVRLAREGAPHGTVVWAEDQTSGRGRMGRTWEGGCGNVYLSVIVRPSLPVALVGRISVACGLGLAEALRNETWQPVRTKWPNDLYLYGKKVGGTLVETGGDWAVVGVGVNVVSHPVVPLPGHPATSLAAHGGVGKVDNLVPSLARAVVKACDLAASGEGWAALAATWFRLDLAAGQVFVVESGESYEAIGERIEDDGALRVKVGDTLRRVTAGDVSIRA
jgi:BirA family transcriptional regulator, biotin operon repressor / biotin---[acetyl-CoA-carboxylase] ligase